MVAKLLHNVQIHFKVESTYFETRTEFAIDNGNQHKLPMVNAQDLRRSGGIY